MVLKFVELIKLSEDRVPSEHKPEFYNLLTF